MIDLTETNNGILLALSVQPGARSDRILGEHGGKLKLSVTQAAEKGKANAAVIALLADRLGITRSSITVLRGHTSRQKQVCIAGISLAELEIKIHEVVEESG